MSYPKICRLCLFKCDDPIEILHNANTGRSSLRAKINKLFRIEIKSRDGLPHCVCKGCSHRVNDIYQFYQTVQNNQDLLMSGTPMYLDEALDEMVKKESQDDTSSLMLGDIPAVDFDDPSMDYKFEDGEEEYLEEAEVSTGGVDSQKMFSVIEYFEEEAEEEIPVEKEEPKKSTIQNAPAAMNVPTAIRRPRKRSERAQKVYVRSDLSLFQQQAAQAMPTPGIVPMTIANDIDSKTEPIIVETFNAEDEIAQFQITAVPDEMEGHSMQEENETQGVLMLGNNDGSTLMVLDPMHGDSQEVILLEAERKIFTPRLKRTRNRKVSDPNEENRRMLRAAYRAKQDEIDKQLSEFYNFTCRLCLEPYKYERFADFSAHMRRAHDEHNLTITCCDKRLTKRKHLYEHMMVHQNPDAFLCLECGKQLHSCNALKHHVAQNHTPEESKPYQCDQCRKRFLNLAYLRQHMVNHMSKEERMNQARYGCEQCPKRFMNPSLLKHHIREVHEGRFARVCEICAQVFINKSSLNQHMMNHHPPDNKTPAVCPYCRQSFVNEMGVKTHVKRYHSGAPRPKCHICGRQVTSKQSLLTHIRFIHEGERPHKCKYCDKAFYKLKTLREHMTMHTGVALYACGYCDRTFNSNANMYAHRKRMHPKEWAERKTTNRTPVYTRTAYERAHFDR